ncbi:collagen alpha-1(II) chain-like [Xenia sp. Carnegie-2017]|uniref:collagen alpha-1(II) chain-like n=1 Tax=Xenia sp. Carnegie-2017 TaxID=2897299 RepID=UPI001F04CEA6|nr:collagen alpha-1(II) chain-like [Xenia sp. Carnegie-2017]
MNGNKGTLGDPGDLGPRGFVGNKGNKGSTGQQGINGRRGDEGLKGWKGRQGPRGPPGPPGPSGSVRGVVGGIPSSSSPTKAKARINRYYQSVFGDLEKKNVSLEQQIVYLSGQTSNIRTPLGSKENPGRTCKDLHVCHPQLKNGYYWIDPNLGCPVDAVRVFCDFTEGGKSCISSSPRQIPQRTWSRGKPKVRMRFSDLSSNFTFRYPISKVQLNFLRLLSKEASQRITYNCRKSTAWYNKKEKSYKYGIRFLGWNGNKFRNKGKLKQKVLGDGCKGDSNKWRKTDFILQTTSVDSLPIVDFSFYYRGLKNEQFGLKIAPVCFS